MEFFLQLISAIITTLTSIFLGDFATDQVSIPVNIVSTTTAEVISVIDGDTIDVKMNDSNARVRVRYIGIDTPEPYATKVPECGSEAATARNRELVSGQQVTIVPGAEPYDTYDRLLAYVYVDNTFVNEQLVQDGYATVFMREPNTQFKKHFTALYQNARAQKSGIWTMCE